MAKVQFDTTLRISVDILNVKAAAQEEGEEFEEEGDDYGDTDQQGSKRGFAAMDPEKRREIARKGGESSHGGGRGRGSSSNSDEELEAMQSLLRSRPDLPESGKREIQEAIDKKREEIGQNAQH